MMVGRERLGEGKGRPAREISLRSDGVLLLMLNRLNIAQQSGYIYIDIYIFFLSLRRLKLS